jgi:hypothetical protein
MWPFSGMSLDVASLTGTVANWILLASLVTGVLSTFVIVKTSDVKEEHWAEDRRKSAEKIAELNNETQRLSADAEASRVDIAIAQEKTAKANAATEEVRRANLELEKAVAPRILDQSPKVTNPLKEFPETTVYIGVIPDWEARRSANQLAILFDIARWKVQPLINDDRPYIDGVQIEYICGLSVSPTGVVGSEFNTQGGLAAKALVAELNRQQIAASEFRIPPNHTAGMRSPTIPSEALVVRVGAKPIMYFLEQQIPALKAAREETERRSKEVQQHIDEMTRRAPPIPDAR